jgi:ATP-binding cassette subfamily B protein
MSFAAIFLAPLGMGIAQLNGLWLKLLTDAAFRRSLTGAALAAGILALAQAFLALQYGAYTRVVLTLNEKVAQEFDSDIASLTTKVPGLEHHELPEYQDKVEMIRRDKPILINAVNTFSQELIWFAMWAVSIALLAAVHPMLLLLVLAAAPQLLFVAYQQRRFRKWQEEVAESQRLSEHLFGLATSSSAGKEIRVFNLESELQDRFESVWKQNHRKLVRINLKGSLQSSIGSLVTTAATVAAMVFVVIRASKGLATPGDVILTLYLCQQAVSMTANLISSFGYFLTIFRAAGRLLSLQDYAEASVRPQQPPVPVPSSIEDGLDLNGLSFRYPNTEPWVLRDLDVKLPAGAVVALVGENGAGKTTLVKLLCRFYEPTQGSIRLDAMDITSFEHDEWRRHVATGFQDFAKFELLARETVGVGDLPRIDDEPAVATALERAGASEVPGKLGAGLETQLGRSWEGGAELSTGQWQKLALGRALMRDVPLLLILDEPTASLDAETEHQLFERFAHASTSARERGGITLLVSHRFSTVRMADLIVVLESGRILEMGSHADLVHEKGLYAELFEIQASAYR